jgi:UV DNA damage repair endonuclease
MQTETNPSNTLTNELSLKLASLQPKKRTANRMKFAECSDDIFDAINRGVSSKAIRMALAEEGVTMSSATFKKLLDAERLRRYADSDEENIHPLFSAPRMEKAHV